MEVPSDLNLDIDEEFEDGDELSEFDLDDQNQTLTGVFI